MHHAQCYQKRMARAYQKKVRPRSFQLGDLVLRAIHLPDAHCKFRPNWCGRYIIKQIFLGGASILKDMDHTEQLEPVNVGYQKKYYQ